MQYVLKNADNLVKEIKQIPQEATSLCVCGYPLHNKTADELARAFEAIPVNVTFLEATFNNYGKKSSEELAQIFAAVPAHITKLDIRFNALTEEQLDAIKRVLPPKITVDDMQYDYKNSSDSVVNLGIFSLLKIKENNTSSENNFTI